MEVIISHISADFDSLASMVAASKLYPQAQLYFASSPSQNVREFLSLYKDYFNIEYPKKVKKLNPTKMIVVDTSIPDRLGDFKEFFTDPQVEVHIFDHHRPTAESVEGDKNYVEIVGATITILLRKIREKKIPITALEATLFALGVYEETGSLTFSQTTKQDVEAIAYLLGKKANLKVVSDYIHHSLNDNQLKILNLLLKSPTAKNIKGFKVLIAKAHAREFIEELSLVVHRMVDIEGVDVVFAIINMKNRVFIIGRSKQPEIDISNILTDFGGGGHANAASAVVKNMDAKTCEQELLKILQDKLKPALSAKDIMSEPLRYINLEEEKTILDAHKALVKFGHSGLVILKDEKLAGILTRHIIDRAIHHGLGNAKIEDYMIKNFASADVDTSLSALQAMMAEHDIGRIPIFKKGKLTGIVTRTDILTALHGAKFKKLPHDYEVQANLEKLAPNMHKLFKICSAVAEKLSLNIFLVGGFVRDLLLGIENLDIDIVVEGDGILFAENLAAQTRSKLITHDKFKTAIVFTKHYKVDIASTRVEFYTRPAALPTVWESSLKQDLYRRDFTVNALAVQINRRGFGKIMDYFGGARDLKDGMIRVLHNLSFIEDPTRIFRAIRFEQRYNFKMEHHTEELLVNALHRDIFSSITNERIREEIILILSEEKPALALRRMAHLNILKVIHKDICFNEKINHSLEEAESLILKYKKILEDEKSQNWVIYFMILVSQLTTEKIRQVAQRFRLSLEIAKKIEFDKVTSSNLIRKLANPKILKSEIYRLLNSLSIEQLVYLMSRTTMMSVRQKIALYFAKLKNTKFIATGDDLTSWNYTPGPYYKKAIQALSDAQLDGIIKNKKEARQYLEKLGDWLQNCN